MDGERSQQQRRGGQGQPGPQRPAVLLALDQRQDDRGQAKRDQRGARQVKAGLLAAGLGDGLAGQQQPEHADRHIQQENAAPAGAPDVRLDQRPAEQLPEDAGDTHGQPVGGERPAAPGPRVDRAQDGEHLRGQQCAGRALQHPRGHQDPGAGRQPAGGGGQREQGQTGNEQPASAVQVAEPPRR